MKTVPNVYTSGSGLLLCVMRVSFIELVPFRSHNLKRQSITPAFLFAVAPSSTQYYLGQFIDHNFLFSHFICVCECECVRISFCVFVLLWMYCDCVCLSVCCEVFSFICIFVCLSLYVCLHMYAVVCCNACVCVSMCLYVCLRMFVCVCVKGTKLNQILTLFSVLCF